jgi:hypothetical protein
VARACQSWLRRRCWWLELKAMWWSALLRWTRSTWSNRWWWQVLEAAGVACWSSSGDTMMGTHSCDASWRTMRGGTWSRL